MLDKLNRPLHDLRISVTDKCNFRCTYCMPKEIFNSKYKYLNKEKLLSFDEINQAIVYGDGKPFLIALIKLNDEYKKTDLKKLIQSLNCNLNSIEKIRKFIVMDLEPTYENGLMTQTMKLKKKKIFLRYKKEIGKLYGNL